MTIIAWHLCQGLNRGFKYGAQKPVVENEQEIYREVRQLSCCRLYGIIHILSAGVPVALLRFNYFLLRPAQGLTPSARAVIVSQRAVNPFAF